MLSTSALAFKLDDHAATWPSDTYQAAEKTTASRETTWSNIMPISNGNSGRRVRWDSRHCSSLRDAKQDNQDWLAAQIASRSVADVVSNTGMSERAVHNIRGRKSKISFDGLVDLCRNDPDFAAAFAAYVGLIKPGEAEFAGALTAAFNAYSRRATA